MIKHELSKPIQAHGEEVASITLRRPTVPECRAIGKLPYVIAKDEAVTIDLEVAAKYFAICGAIPAPLAYGMYMPPFTWRVSPVM